MVFFFLILSELHYIYDLSFQVFVLVSSTLKIQYCSLEMSRGELTFLEKMCSKRSGIKKKVLKVKKNIYKALGKAEM